MRILLFVCVLQMLFYNTYCQTTAIFSLRDDSQYVLCYTEYSNGIPVKNTELEFKNTSSCSGNCRYIFDFGDNTPQVIKDTTSNTSHFYTTDGIFDVRLQVLSLTSIHDSIKNRPIVSVVFLSHENDSSQLQIGYTGTDNTEKSVILKIADTDYARKTLSQPITVYSPFVEADNYIYEIDDPSTDEIKAPVQSFTHVFTVDTSNFKPHDISKWTYYWEVFKTNEYGEPENTPFTQFHVDSIEYRYTFPAENYNPGYYVKLKIALDTSKFDNYDDVTYYNLEQCTYSKHQIIPVTDYYFTDNTQKNNDIKSRKAHVPNTFTPGGNDENDVFFFNTNGVDVFSVWIYNSWGGLVYTQEAQTISWIGNDNVGQKCPSGVYYYVIQSSNRDKRHESSGFIQLFRQD
ncbi:MAG TPA: gliding motility-associated C-terminal domain-containing protein [Bacteroidales bacterium]|nr:gliding motility-associated C-terminal domain-containing protein [Bacteroidales bacterium]